MNRLEKISKNSMDIPKGEKKKLTKFVPPRNLPRDQEIKFPSMLLAWQELGGPGSSQASFCQRAGDPTAKQHEQDQPAHLKPIPDTHTDAVKRMLAKSRPGLQDDRAGRGQNGTLNFGQEDE